MSTNEHLALAAAQLDRILGFFARVDAKSSALFAINSGMIAVLCANLSASDILSWYVVLAAALALGLLLVSQYFIYKCAFPTLKGGHSSLIYFREIAKKTEANFIDQFLASEIESMTKDFLGQVWRNSEILKIKFDALKVSFILTATALLPWTVFLVATAILHGHAPSLH
jgi:hypothetical protein